MLCSFLLLADTGAEGMLMVPSDVFAAFQAYYTAASQQVWGRFARPAAGVVGTRLDEGLC